MAIIGFNLNDFMNEQEINWHNKKDRFIDWLCGKTDKFPFFKKEDLPHFSEIYQPKEKLFKKYDKRV